MSIKHDVDRLIKSKNYHDLEEYLYRLEPTELEFSDGLYAAYGYHKLHKLEEAIRILSNTKINKKTVVPVRHQRGIYKFEAGNFASALEDFNFVMDKEVTSGEVFCSSEAAYFAILICHKTGLNIKEEYFRLIDDCFQAEYEGVMIVKRDIIRIFQQ